MTAWQATNTITIKAPADQVFETLREQNELGPTLGVGALRWGYRTQIRGDERLVDEGSVISHRVLSLRFDRRVEAIDQNTRIVERYIGPDYEGTGTWELDARAEGVELSYVYDAADTGRQAKLIHALFGDRMHRHFYDHGLRRLKRRVEAEAAAD